MSGYLLESGSGVLLLEGGGGILLLEGGMPSTSTLYGAKGGSSASNLYTIDPVTGIGTSVGPIGFAVTGLAFDPTDGQLYGATSNQSPSHPRALIRINKATGAGTLVADFGLALGIVVSDIAFTSAGVLYGTKFDTVALTSPQLVGIDKATAAITPHGYTWSGPTTAGLTIDAADLAYEPIGSYNLLAVDLPAAAAVTDLGVMSSPLGGAGVAAAAVGSADGLIWLIGLSGGTAQLWTVAADLTATLVANLANQMDALAWDGPLGTFLAPPPPSPPTTKRAKSELWRFIVTSLDSTTLSLLDNRSTGRRVVFTLNAPAYHEGQVGSDDPEINIPWPTATSPAFLAPNTRLIYGFQREIGASPPWVCRFGGIVMSVEDEGADVPTSRYTAYDPWQLLMARPIRDPGTPFSLPGIDGLTFPAGSRASDIAAVLLAATELEDGETHIDFSDDSLIHDTDLLAADITFDQGLSVGEAWQQLCDTGTLDIVLEPMYEPITAPGKVVRFSTWKPPNALTPEAGGTLRADAVMGWDRAGKSLTGISRLVDGTRLANVVQFYANQTAVPVQSDAASITAVGQYWAQQFFPGTGNDELVALMAVAELAIRRNGQRSISLDPGPERTVIALRDYNLRDYVPVWSSKRLREPLAIDYTAYDPDIPSGAGYLRIYQIPIEITDDGASLVRGIMTGKDVG